MDIFYTVDSEAWLDKNKSFDELYNHWILGKSRKGEYGLNYQIKGLEDYGLKGSFFVEPLFSRIFGREYLLHEVDLINKSNSEVQLHVHPEYDSYEFQKKSIIENKNSPRMSDYSEDEQFKLIKKALEILRGCGAKEVCAYRSGNFSVNYNTLCALRNLGITYDTSFNFCIRGKNNGINDSQFPEKIIQCPPVSLYPISFFKDKINSFRHFQLNALSFNEMKHFLEMAYASGVNAVVIVSHTFELINQKSGNPNFTVIKRFHKLCKYLSKNKDRFAMKLFRENPSYKNINYVEINSNIFRTYHRIMQQIYKRLRYR